MRPNYFLAVPLAHYDAVTEHIARIQAALVEGHPELEGTLVDPATAHLTLFVLSLHDPVALGLVTAPHTYLLDAVDGKD